ncbi:MAG: AAA family ATPase, partial [Anaerolineae bacterium]
MPPTPLGAAFLRCSWNRRKALFLAADALGCNKLALGHHADDAAVTALMNLLFTGRLETLEPKVAFFGGRITVIRPLIYIPAKDLTAHARALGFPLAPPCPYGRDANRQKVEDFLRSFGPRQQAHIRTNLWRATRKESANQRFADSLIPSLFSMRLQRLELQGYKSFADRTEFVFPTGITAIVGPNGSGKSNIADAIRWALGEQSLRLLRGKTTEDMIFSGSGRRPRAGMAQVLLTLDNGDGWLPVDFAEVTLGRRAYRSGESEYLLNGNRVRLRDLMDLLAESGLAQRTYTVIGQGLVDMALSLQPQERRTLFEEAAGISVYRARREESAAQLDETERNLERVRDLLGEIAPRLKRLEEQMARFQEYERVSGYLKQLQRAWYGYHWGQAQGELQRAQERARAAEAALAARQAEAETVAARLADLRRRQTELRNDLRDAYRRVADLHERMDAAQRELAALTERARLLAAREEELRAELEPLQAQEAAQAERVRAAQAQEAELRERVAAQEARVAAMEAELAELRRQVQEQTVQRDRVEAELRALRARRDELEAALAQTRALLARLEAEQELLARMRDEMAGLAEGTRRILQ